MIELFQHAVSLPVSLSLTSPPNLPLNLPMLAAYFHSLSPTALDLGPIALKWYGLSYAAGFLIAWLLLRWFARKGITPLSPVGVTDAMLALVLGVVFGGRLGYVLVYDPALLYDFSKSFPFWGAIDISRGGMASHGGMIGVIIACFWVARRADRTDGTRGTSVLHVIDLTAIACTFGLGLGRLANFVNGELLGSIVAYPGAKAPWWAVRFPQEYLEHKDMNLAAEQHAAIVALAQKYTSKPIVGKESLEIAYRHMLELLHSPTFSGKAELIQALTPLISARHPSQLYQFLAEGVLLTAALWFIWRVPRKPGVVGAWFLLIYGVLRIVTEIWRLPDIGHARTAGLSLGQWLSVAMVVVGTISLPIVAKRPVARMGGWLRKA